MLRILLGAAVAFWFVGRERHQWLALAGLAPMATGWLGWCPIYQLFGLHTDGPV